MTKTEVNDLIRQLTPNDSNLRLLVARLRALEAQRDDLRAQHRHEVRALSKEIEALAKRIDQLLEEEAHDEAEGV